jgi:hypothetical protein
MRRKGRKIPFGTHQFEPRNRITSCITQCVRDCRFRAGTRTNHAIFALDFCGRFVITTPLVTYKIRAVQLANNLPFLMVGFIGPHTIFLLLATFWLTGPGGFSLPASHKFLPWRFSARAGPQIERCVQSFRNICLYRKKFATNLRDHSSYSGRSTDDSL